MWSSRARDDAGVAMVTGLLAVTVSAFLAATAVSLSLHNNDASGRDRSRTQAIHAAEAGIDTAIATISGSSLATLPCTTTGTTSSSPAASWTVEVGYYASNDTTGTALTCAPGVGVAVTPGSVMLRSTGQVNYGTAAVTRVLQAQLELAPVLGSFTQAIYSKGSPDIANNITVNGHQGDDADFYTDGSWVCPNSTELKGSVLAQGSISMSNSCSVAVDAWANGSITMSNTAKVQHDAISSASSANLTNSAQIGRNMRVGTTCTGCTTGSSGRVAGTVTTYSPQGPPPELEYPTIQFDQQAWVDDGYTVVPATCAAARTWLTSSANRGTKAVLRITDGCTLAMWNDDVVRDADLAIVTNGPITLGGGSMRFRSGTSAFHKLFLIVESGVTCTTNTSGTPGTIFMTNQVGFSNLHYFVYAPCKVSFANNNSGARGQIYGAPVHVANRMSFTYYPTVVPGAGEVVGFDPKMGFLREIR